MIVLPVHEPCGERGMGEQRADTLDVICSVARTWRKVGKEWVHTDGAGCGGLFRVDARTGLYLPPIRPEKV